MIRAAAALARDDDPARAAAAAADRARAGRPVDAAFVFAAGYGAGASRAASAAAEVLGCRAIAGATGHGVLAGAEEDEERPAVSVLALSGVEATPLRMADLAGAEDAAGAEIEAALGRSAAEGDLVVLLADPVALDVRRLLGSCDEVLPPGSLVGAGAAIGPGLVWTGREPVVAGAGGLVLHLPAPPRTIVSHGCRPITPPLPVSRVDGHWLLELDGRPALDVYREAAGPLLGADLRRAGGLVHVALPRGPAGEAFVVRNVAGFAPDRRAFAVAEDLRPGALVRLALRDADLAREDLGRALAGAREPASAALYLSCSGRGQSLFRHAGVESGTVAHALGRTPLAGLFASFQFAPVAGVTELHTYAAVLTLLP